MQLIVKSLRMLFHLLSNDIQYYNNATSIINVKLLLNESIPICRPIFLSVILLCFMSFDVGVLSVRVLLAFDACSIFHSAQQHPGILMILLIHRNRPWS